MIGALLLAVSASYLTLGVAATHAAENLSAPYAIVVCVLTLADMWWKRHARRR